MISSRSSRSEQPPPRNVTAVGGIVVGTQGVLLVRMTYGPTKGRYWFPGGVVDPGETLDEAVVREVREETGVETRVIGPCAIRTRCDGPNNDTYVIFLLEPVAGTARPDGRENDDVRYFSLSELDSTEVAGLPAYLGRLALRGELRPHLLATDFDAPHFSPKPQAWKLFR